MGSILEIHFTGIRSMKNAMIINVKFAPRIHHQSRRIGAVEI
jgi:hypothetical protein